MPRAAKELSAIEVRRLAGIAGYHPVGGVAGLMLRVGATGASWVLSCTIATKRAELGSIGAYPEITLAAARAKATELRASIKAGNDPRQRKATVKHTFAAVAAKYIEAHRAGWRNAKHAAQWQSTLETYAYPVIGDKAVAQITTENIFEILTPIWAVKTETATRIRCRIEAVINYAQALGYAPRALNPAVWRGGLEHALPKAGKLKHVVNHPAIPFAEAPAFYRRLKDQPGTGALALRFGMLTAARSGEVRGATWPEIDLQAALWTVPGERMKAGKTHRVPLNSEAVALLKSLPHVEGEPYVFFSPMKPGKPLSDMTLLAAMRRMKVEAVPHGLRSTFKDWASELSGAANEVSEQALAHGIESKVEAAYRRGDLLQQRVKLMNDWCEYLTRPVDSKVLPFTRVA